MEQIAMIAANENHNTASPNSFRTYRTTIKVVGLGGAGGNTINRLMTLNLPGIEFISCNTDAQALGVSTAHRKILMGNQATRGMGAGGNPEVGKKAAEESVEELRAAMKNADMIFLTCGMGGGTGTGSISVAARIARESGALTVGVVTTPFEFEGTPRMRNATHGISTLREYCDTLITVPNQKLLNIVPKDGTMELAFRISDEILRQAIQGVAELVTSTGIINVDFADIRNLMSLPGGTLLTIGQGKGDKKCEMAINRALGNSLLDLNDLDKASGILLYFTGGEDLTLDEVITACQRVREIANPAADVKFGYTSDARFNGKAQIILIATGVGSTPSKNFPVQAKPAVGVVETPAEPIEANSPKLSAMEMDWVVKDTQGLSASKLLAYENLDMPAYLRRGINVKSAFTR
ncbi:MAG TPA: cell division protein FtsZ [Anaerolineales bacterium]|nr:cell division protein FtsZ [Anaerolineales bacterium]